MNIPPRNKIQLSQKSNKDYKETMHLELDPAQINLLIQVINGKNLKSEDPEGYYNLKDTVLKQIGSYSQSDTEIRPILTIDRIRGNQ